MITQPMSLAEIRVVGNAALLKALGPVGMIRYLQQFETGSGNYSVERQAWLAKLDLDTLLNEIRKLQQTQRE